VAHRGLLLALCFVGLVAWRDPSCGTDSTAGGIDTPCTRSSDCKGGLTCSGAVCVGEVKGGSDAGDAGDGQASDGNGVE